MTQKAGERAVITLRVLLEGNLTQPQLHQTAVLGELRSELTKLLESFGIKLQIVGTNPVGVKILPGQEWKKGK